TMARRNARNRQPTPSPPPSPSPSPPHRQAPNAAGAHLKIVLQFQSLTPPEFHGTEGPEAVAEWIRQLEQNFDLLQCSDGQKFYPQGYRMRMERAFWDLTQGTGTVEEYEREFTRMSAFAPHMVDTDLKKAHKFRDGLSHTLRMHVASQGNLSFDETVIRATQLESYQTPNVSAPSVQLVQPISSAPPDSSSGNRKFDSRRDNRKGKRGGNDRRGERPFARDQFLKCRNCGCYHLG
ncbi:Unknown protein, partial [Striga hermonthica]